MRISDWSSDVCSSDLLGSLSTFARGFRLIGADGEAHWCDADTNADLYQAQRLSLGLFGVATEIEVAVVPAFHLAERIEKRRWEEINESYDELARRHRHIEFWLFPHSDHVILKTLDPCDPCDPPPTTIAMEEEAFRSDEHTSELQSQMRNSYAVFCLKK